MKTKTIIGLLLFSVTFIFSAALTDWVLGTNSASRRFGRVERRYESRTQRKIFKLLRQDIQNGQARFGKLARVEGDYRPPFSPEALTVYEKAVAEYVAESGSIDDANLPQEFQTAWREHMRAWREHSAFLTALKNRNMDGACSTNIIRKYEEKDREISATWYRALDIAERYDAVPRGAYSH